MTTTPEPDYVPFLPSPANYAAKQSSLSAEQEELYKVVLNHFSNKDYSIPDIQNGELIEEEKYWLSYECMLRYLRATKWQSSNAIRHIEDTLRWRRDFGLYDSLTAELVEPEAVTGKQFLFGYDTAGRPTMYWLLSRQNTKDGLGQIQLLVWIFERAIELMPAGVETIAVLVDFGENGRAGSVSHVRNTVNVLQTHYPERLGKALLQNAPYFFTFFFKLVEPFVDSHTREKIRFSPNVIEEGLYTPEMVLKDWGGTRELVWQHDVYWPALIKLAGDRKKVLMETWRGLGATVGLKEWDVKQSESAP